MSRSQGGMAITLHDLSRGLWQGTSSILYFFKSFDVKCANLQHQAFWYIRTRDAWVERRRLLQSVYVYKHIVKINIKMKRVRWNVSKGCDSVLFWSRKIGSREKMRASPFAHDCSDFYCGAADATKCSFLHSTAMKMTPYKAPLYDPLGYHASHQLTLASTACTACARWNERTVFQNPCHMSFHQT